MRKGRDIAVELPGLYLVHHNLPGKEVESHSHKEHLLFLPLQGEIAVKADGRNFRCSPGKMIYLPPDTEHSFESSTQQGERLIALIDHRAWSKSEGQKFQSRILPNNQLIKELCFYLLINQKTLGKSGVLVTSIIHVLNGALDAGALDGSMEMEHMQAKISDVRVRKAFDFIAEHFAEEITLPKLAKISGLSVRNLNRLFLQETGITPKKSLALQRISKAKELLAAPGISVTSAALEVGYNSLSQFIRIFQNITGTLPSDYGKW